MAGNMELICEKWAPMALEYMKFLARHEIEAIGIVSEKLQFGCNIKIFGDGDRYLELSFGNKKFEAEEKQLNELLEAVEKLALLIFYENEEDEELDEDYYDAYLAGEDEET